MDDKSGCLNSFIIWLSNRGLSRNTIDEYITSLNATSQYCSKYTAFNIWNVSKPQQIDDLMSVIELDKSEGKYLPLAYNEIPLLMLKMFLNDEMEKNKSENEKKSDSKEENSELDYKYQLDNTTKLLQNRYSNKPAENLSQIIKENPDVSIVKLSLWAKEVTGVKANEYLIIQGIIKKESKSAEYTKKIVDLTQEEMEIAIIIDTYYRMRMKEAPKCDVASYLSFLLSDRAEIIGDKKYSKYRDYDFILKCLNVLDNQTSRKGNTNSPEIFKRMLRMYRNEPERFDLILKQAYAHIKV